MKSACKILLLSAVFAATFAYAQTLRHFQHIIILFQENRTPDNLFGGNTTFEPGVDLQQSPLGQQWCLGACFDPNHSHASWEAIWAPGNGQKPMCNGGKSACTNSVTLCPPIPPGSGGTTCNGVVVTTPQYPQETYVSTGYDSSAVQPYFDIAEKYGFANYMFQTNEGPSNPAHQFIFSGTSSAAGNSGQQYYQDFTAENPNIESDTGCAGDASNRIRQIDQNGRISGNGGPPLIVPCFDHNTLANLLDPNGVGWRYYASPGSPPSTNGLWTAPNSIKDICAVVGTNCGGPEWDNHVVADSKQILADLEPPVGSNPGCDLQAVSWVIPYGDRSDHPGLAENDDSTKTEHGPAWVADVINEVGTTTCNDNGVPYWQDTAIFITWDDWGGFWDHIDPAAPGGPGVKINNPPMQTCDSTTTFGCGYTYGFRVPLLVVSAYTGTKNKDGSYSGYVSGACGPSPLPSCPNFGLHKVYVHDFGSILAFIENNFLGFNEIGQINPNYQFADAFAPDYTPPPSPHVPLADFFTLTSPRPFQQIVLPPAWQSYDANYFLNYNGPIMDPDNDAIDND